MCTKKDTIKKRKRKSKESFKLPTLKDIEKYYDDNPNIRIYPEVVYNYFKEANWKYPNGKRAYNVANMVNFLNGKFIRHESLSVVQNRKVSKHKPKKEKWVPYEEQLQDSKWFEFRRKVFEIRGAKCEHCGSLIHLQVHHPKYLKGRKAWEYKISDVIVLCRDCHKKVHNIKE